MEFIKQLNLLQIRPVEIIKTGLNEDDILSLETAKR